MLTLLPYVILDERRVSASIRKLTGQADTLRVSANREISARGPDG